MKVGKWDSIWVAIDIHFDGFENFVLVSFYKVMTKIAAGGWVGSRVTL